MRILGPQVRLGFYLGQSRSFVFYQTNSHYIANIVFPFLVLIIGYLYSISLISIWRYIPLECDRGLDFSPFESSIFGRNVSGSIALSYQRIKFRMPLIIAKVPGKIMASNHF